MATEIQQDWIFFLQSHNLSFFFLWAAWFANLLALFINSSHLSLIQSLLWLVRVALLSHLWLTNSALAIQWCPRVSMRPASFDQILTRVLCSDTHMYTPQQCLKTVGEGACRKMALHSMTVLLLSNMLTVYFYRSLSHQRLPERIVLLQLLLLSWVLTLTFGAREEGYKSIQMVNSCEIWLKVIGQQSPKMELVSKVCKQVQMEFCSCGQIHKQF